MTIHHNVHTVTADKAIAYLLSHGVNHASLTKEGILAISWLGSGLADKETEGDGWCEDMMVFPLDDDGRTPSRAIRNWLGY